MSLPVRQQRVIGNIEGILRASEPHLASMFTIFARLHADEPIGTELLASTRRRWPRPGNAVYAIVLIPVLFAAIIIGALLGGSARSPATCDAGYSVGVSATRFTTMTGGDQALSPPARAETTTADLPGMC
jgi:hypothetical protein